MLKLYGIPNCNTVKKARVWLDANNISYTFHDFKKHGVTPELLQHWVAQVSWQQLVNRSGTTWRGLPDETKTSITDPASALALMLKKPSVIKRPVLVRDDNIVLIGFIEDDYQRTAR